MLNDQVLDSILERIPYLTIGVLGDLFLDRYLDIDDELSEPSLETGLDAYQVVRVRSCPGAAGTVMNNLVALGVKKVCAISVIGDDGEGYELLRALDLLRVVDRSGVVQDGTRRTPTYTKPMLQKIGTPPKELNRLDIKNRTPLSKAAEDSVLTSLHRTWKQLDALIVSDQVSEAECGVVPRDVRNHLAKLGNAEPGKVILADSREHIGLFRSVWTKPNSRECIQATGEMREVIGDGYQEKQSGRDLALATGRPVFCTRGDHGILVIDPRPDSPRIMEVPAYPVRGPIDIVGAGDSANAGITCALAAGADLDQAASFGCLVASITIQQIGTTGTATQEQVRQRWREVQKG